MVNNMEIEKALKRFIKQKKVGYSAAMLVSFLITGSILSAAELSSNELLLKDVQIKRAELLKKLAANNERLEEIDKEIVALIKEGDSYAKTLENNKQFFFPLTWEHRHASKADDNGFFDKGTVPENKPDLELEDVPEPTIPGFPPATDKTPDVGVDEPNITIDPVGGIEIEPGIDNVVGYQPKDNFVVENIDSLEVIVDNVTLDGSLEIGITAPDDQLSNVVGNRPTEIAPVINISYNPNFITDPTEADADDVTAPEGIEFKALSIKAGGFGQGAGGYKDFAENNQVVIENYDSYDTSSKGMDITFNEYDITYKETESNVTLNKDITDINLRDSYEKLSGYGEKEATFISDTKIDDIILSGTYKLNYTKGINEHVRMFFSFNPAGIGNWFYDASGNEDGSGYGYNNGEKDNYRIKTAKVDANVILTNKTDNSYLVGIDHQTWDWKLNKYSDAGLEAQKDTEYAKTYSILNSAGTITLGETKEDKNMIGIMIDVEHGNASQYKLANHKTINSGTIQINGSQSIGISFEETDDANKYNLRDDLYTGKVNVGGEYNYGLRIRNLGTSNNNYFDETRIYGINGNVEFETNGLKQTIEKVEITKSKIAVTGNNNVGVVIGKGLSDTAEKYLVNGKYYVKDNNNEAKDIINGKVNPIANIKGLKITVGGESNIGFLRDKDYSNNNTADMIIRENVGTDINGKGAIESIAFAEGAKNSVLIRSDQHGILLRKNLGEINGINVEKEITTDKDGNQKIENKRNLVFQATATKWTDGNSEVRSAGKVTLDDNFKIGGNSSGIIGMMASTTSGNPTAETEKAEIVNKGDIAFTGENNIGMAVLGNNKGTLEGTATKKATISVKQNPTATEQDYNLGIYNEGTFTIKNAAISTDGLKSVGIYNTNISNAGTITLNETNTIDVKNGAIGIYSTGGTITSNGDFSVTVNDEEAGTDNNLSGGTGIFATVGAKISLNGNSNKIDVKNGDTAVASTGTNSNVTINNGEIYYSGDGYALFTKDGGTIEFNGNSEVTLDGNSFGMKVDLGAQGAQAVDISGLTFKVASDDVTVFNLVSPGAQYNIDSLMSDIYDNLDKAFGLDGSTDTIQNKISGETGIDNYKVAIVDGGKLTIDKSIHQSDAEKNADGVTNTFGFFYFKRFLGQKLDVTVGQTDTSGNAVEVVVDGTMTTEHADKYFKGQIVGLEMNSSSSASDVADSKITLKDGATVIANRLNDNNTNDAKGGIGIYGNFGTITLENGSKVEVEKEDTSLDDWKNHADTDEILDEGVGIYAVNGSIVTISDASPDGTKEAAKIDVYGNKAVGIYAMSYRMDGEKNVGAEFGNQAGQGEIHITNAGNVTLHGKGSTGIYANNNNETTGSIGNAVVNNSGTITVGGAIIATEANENSISSVGIYGSNVKISNTGTIAVGTDDKEEIGGIGIFAQKGTQITELGTIKLGSSSTAIMLDKDSTITVNAGETLTMLDLLDTDITDNSDNKEVRIGVHYQGDGTQSDTMNYNIDMGKVIGGKAVIAEKRNVTLDTGRTITVNGEDSRGMRAINGTITNNGIITLNGINHTIDDDFKGSIGMLAMDNDGIIHNTGEINVNSTEGIGIYVTNQGDTANNNTVTGIGTINLKGEKTVGVLLNEGTMNLTNTGADGTLNASGINFNNGAKNAVGIYALDSTVSLASGTTLNNGTDITKIVDTGNVLLYGAGSTTIANNGEIVVANNTYSPTDSDTLRNIGIYLDENGAYPEGRVVYSGTGTIVSQKGAIGLYTELAEKNESGNNKPDQQSSKAKLTELNLEVDSQGTSTIGAVFKGVIDKTDGKNIEDTVEMDKGMITLNNSDSTQYNAGTANKATGIFAEGVALDAGTLVIKHGTGTNNDGSNGTGIYLKDGAYLAGGTITLSGNGIAVDHDNDSNTNNEVPMSVGIYYAEDAGTTNNAAVSVTKDSTIAVYSANADGITQNADITLGTEQAGINGIGIYANNGAVTLASGKIITTYGSNTDKEKRAIGIYRTAENPVNGSYEVINNGIMNINGKYDVGIYASAGVDVQNKGTITVAGESGTGVYLTGTGAHFTNEAGGKIAVNGEHSNLTTGTGIGIYLKDGAEIHNTDINFLTVKKGNTGIYAEGSATNKTTVSGKTIDLTATENEGAIALAASGNTEITETTVKVAADSTGIYALNTGVKINGVTVSAEQDAETKTTSSVGIYLKECDNTAQGHTHGDYQITGSTVNIKKGVGIFINNENENTYAGLHLDGTTNKNTINVNSYDDSDSNTESGIGIYVQKKGVLSSEGNEYNITNGIGVYGETDSNIILGGKVENGSIIGNTNVKETINLNGYSIGAFTNGGEIYIGSNVNVKTASALAGTGTDKKEIIAGSLAYAVNGNINSSAAINTIKINADTNVDENFDKTENFVGLFGKFTDADQHKITNTGAITISGTSSIGIAAVGEGTNTANVIDNSGNITITGKIPTNLQPGQSALMSAGIYSTSAGINNTGTINAGDAAVGIAYNGKTAYDINNDPNDGVQTIAGGTVNLTGNRGIGASLSGTAGTINFTEIKSDKAGNLGVYADGLTADGINLDKIALADNSMGLYVNNSKNTDNTKALEILGNVIVGNGESVGAYINNSSVNLTGTIKAGEGGTALYNENGTVTVKNVEVTNGKGTFIYSKGGNVVLGLAAPKAMSVTDGHYGFIAENGGSITSAGDITLNVSNGAMGFVSTGENTSISGITDINVSSGTADKYSVGGYFRDSGSKNITGINISQTGNKTVGLVLHNTSGTITQNINLTDLSNNGIGIIVEENNKNKTTINGNISVSGTENIGLVGNKSDVTTNGSITVGKGATGKYLPAGIYLTSDTGNSYVGNANGTAGIKVGDYATGIIGKNYGIEYTGNVEAGTAAIGIMGENTLGLSDMTIKVTGDIKAGISPTAGDGGIGIYGTNMNITTTGNITVGDAGNNNGNIGILNIGKGDIIHTGNVTVNGTENLSDDVTSSIGIYKGKGSGTITVNTGKWTVGDNAYGIVVRNPDDKESIAEKYSQVVVNNASDMTLGKGGIGIYTFGNHIVNNTGEITVGTAADGTLKDSSIGIYMINYLDKADAIAKGTNSGIITANEDHTVGVQAVGGVEFTNQGTIRAANGATAMLASQSAKIINNGTIVLGETAPTDNFADDDTSRNSTGMYAMKDSIVVNGKDGVIYANNGIGMYIADGASGQNYGEIHVYDGKGIVTNGSGTFSNMEGAILKIHGNGTEKEDGTTIPEDNVITYRDGFAEIGSNLFNAGIVDSDIPINLDYTLIDITLSDKLGFKAPEISGIVRLSSNFAVTGNGYSYDIDDFAGSDINLDVDASPLFKAEITDGDLSILKRNYAAVANDIQYNSFYNALDEKLQADVVSKESELLKELNRYLAGLGTTPQFYEEFARTMGDARGNIYANVQSRMQDINRTFENSFDEMEQSYNLSKDTDKFSVIYTNGDYKNSKAGIIDYDYNIAGLMYMKEFEGLEYGNKYGYTFGFTGSEFKFEDAGSSEEKVYSLRAGAHNVKDFGNGLDMLTKADAGFNYHETDRKVVFGGNSYENDADFNSYYVSLENKFRKTLYEDYENEFGTYLGLDLEYGRFDDIKEDGSLELKVKGNDYFISKLETGFAGTGRKYLGNDWTMKLTGDVGYSYDFGKNYGENKAKLRDASEGYYSLMSEVESRGAVSGKIGVGFEKLNHLGVTLEGEVAKDFRRDEEYWKVGLRFNYKFNKEDAVTTIRNTFNLLGNHFAFDKDEVSSRDKKIISEGSRLIDKHSVKGTIVIEGHTDSFGTEKYNQNLSEKRAANVETEFRKNIQKAENIQYDTKGYGESRPIESNDTPEGRAANRRTDVKFIDKR